MNKIAIIILNYNSLKNTIECIKSVKKLKKTNCQLKIIVIDNNSHDNSIEILQKIKGIKFIKSNGNLGYSGGNNLGIKLALKKECQYLLIINNDTIVDKNLLVNLLNNSKEADIIAPKIYVLFFNNE